MTRAVRRFRWARRCGISLCEHPPGKEESGIDFRFSREKRIWQSHILIISSILHCLSLSRGRRQRLSPLTVGILTDV